ncbi:hypothetical protein E4T56_gene20276 [Termitomyces sp. T112]|nr:hypothetical protein E4T56_gene20276 [Termitomyces sp. T112]
MAHTFLDWVDHLLSVAHASLWFKTVGSGVEWPELANIEKECCQLYEQYKEEEWVCSFDVHFASVNPSLEFLMDNLMAGMMVSTPAVTNASDTTKHLVGALVVARGEEQSKGHRGEANCGDIQEGPLTPKAVAGSIARGLATSPRLATTLRSKGKGKGKVQEEDDEDIERTWSDMLLCQAGDDKLEWLGKDLAWLTLLTPAMSLVDFDKRAAGV